MKDLAENWIRYQLLPPDSEEAGMFEWAEKEAAVLSMTSPEESWKFIVKVIEKSQHEWILTNIAAGPLDNLLSFYPAKVKRFMRADIPGNKKLQTALHRILKNEVPHAVSTEWRYPQAS